MSEASFASSPPTSALAGCWSRRSLTGRRRTASRSPRPFWARRASLRAWPRRGTAMSPPSPSCGWCAVPGARTPSASSSRRRRRWGRRALGAPSSPRYRACASWPRRRPPRRPSSTPRTPPPRRRPWDRMKRPSPAPTAGSARRHREPALALPPWRRPPQPRAPCVRQPCMPARPRPRAPPPRNERRCGQAPRRGGSPRRCPDRGAGQACDRKGGRASGPRSRAVA
mmetsp:Transcript_52092/g.151653  ORF Transcript_52092/g.151653 Transcript_52092/m.151653 type:complete len:226 (-) Transcript_52092:42-719(-)